MFSAIEHNVIPRGRYFSTLLGEPSNLRRSEEFFVILIRDINAMREFMLGSRISKDSAAPFTMTNSRN